MCSALKICVQQYSNSPNVAIYFAVLTHPIFLNHDQQSFIIGKDKCNLNEVFLLSGMNNHLCVGVDSPLDTFTYSITVIQLIELTLALLFSISTWYNVFGAEVVDSLCTLRSQNTALK